MSKSNLNLYGRAVLFDLDNTLTDLYAHNLRPEAAAWLKANKPQKVAVCTNQGGVGLRYWMEPRPSDGCEGFGDKRKWQRLPTAADVLARITAVSEAMQNLTGGTVLFYVSYRYRTKDGRYCPVPPKAAKLNDPAWSEDWRKPGAGMLLAACRDLLVLPRDCVFIGDDHNFSDSQAAAAAGMPFMYPHHVF